jgi:hypothetical protein
MYNPNPIYPRMSITMTYSASTARGNDVSTDSPAMI